LIIFIGRLEKDTGLPIYLNAVKSKKFKSLKLKIIFLSSVKDVKPYIDRSRFVFTSGYLSILEAMVSKKLVFAVYDNPLKKDYLKMAGFSRWIIISKNSEELIKKVKYYLDHPKKEKQLVEKAYQFAKKQTWEQVAMIYEKLWQK